MILFRSQKEKAWCLQHIPFIHLVLHSIFAGLPLKRKLTLQRKRSIAIVETQNV
jgi:hypothetical protein